MIRINNLHFSYMDSDFSLDIPTLSISKGESIAITGPSGSGKTTLLNLICGVSRPQKGDIYINGASLNEKSEKALRQHRIANIGMVFQAFELLEYLNVLDNILLPYRLDSTLHLDSQAVERAKEIASTFGIDDKLKRYPSQLSQGEKQRVAIIRALITGAKLIVADEPTGNLDPENTNLVADQLLEFVKKEGATLVTVTHDHDFAKRFDKVIDFTDLLKGEKNA
ncbi:MAG: ABC transporter ATP-binding protein [Sulfurimonadaceae bacterium]